MGLYNVYLGTPLKFPSSLEFSTIRSTLEAWFQKVVEKSGGFTGARVQYADNQPAIQPHELLIYLVWSQGDSLVKAMLPKQKLGGRWDDVHGGRSNGVGSLRHECAE